MAKTTEQKEANTRSKYDVRLDALQLSIETFSDNRSRDETDVIRAAQIYEEFLEEANTGE